MCCHCTVTLSQPLWGHSAFKVSSQLPATHDFPFRLYVNWRFMRGIEAQFLALQKGFNELIPQHLLKPFDQKELEVSARYPRNLGQGGSWQASAWVSLVQKETEGTRIASSRAEQCLSPCQQLLTDCRHCPRCLCLGQASLPSAHSPLSTLAIHRLRTYRHGLRQ